MARDREAFVKRCLDKSYIGLGAQYRESFLGRRPPDIIGCMEHTGHPVPNPYVDVDGYRCFGCDPNNPIGLRLRFMSDGTTVWTDWEPRDDLEGYPGVIHGGIQATLADELAAWYIHAILGTAGVTRELKITYHTPARSSDRPFRLSATAGERVGRNLAIDVELRGASGTLFSSARCSYVVFSEEVARRRLSFPGREAFGLDGPHT